MRFINKIKKDERGVSLLEMLVAVGLFALVILAATSIFSLVAKGQRSAIDSQNIQESIRYAFETISKEIRMARKDTIGDCTGVANKIFSTNGEKSELYFLNKDGLCVNYWLENSRFNVKRGLNEGYLTSDDIEASNLEFIIDDAGGKQAKVTFKVDVKAAGEEEILKMQSTIASRYYE